MHFSFIAIISIAISSDCFLHSEDASPRLEGGSRDFKDYKIGAEPTSDSQLLQGSIKSWRNKSVQTSSAVTCDDLSLVIRNMRSVNKNIQEELKACVRHLELHDKKGEADSAPGPWERLRVDIPLAQAALMEAPQIIAAAEARLRQLQAEEQRQAYLARLDFDRSKPAPTRVVTSRITPVRLKRGLEEDFTVKGKDLEARTFTSKSGYKLPYRIFLPPYADKEHSLPLVLFIHGNGDEAGNDNISQFKHSQILYFAQMDSQKKNPCALVVPQFPKGVVLNTGTLMPVEKFPEQNSRISEPAQAVMELMQHLETENKALDPKRRYGIGLSSGGAGLIELSVRRPGSFAAVVGLSTMGGCPIPSGEILRTGYWFFYNQDEVPWLIKSGEATLKDAARNGCQTRLTIATAQKGHAAWQWALFLPELPTWMFQQKLP